MTSCGLWGQEGPTYLQQSIIIKEWNKVRSADSPFTERHYTWFNKNIVGRYWFTDNYKIICFENETDAILYGLTWN